MATPASRVLVGSRPTEGLRERAERLGRRLETFVERVGRASAWLTLALALLVAGNVLARYLFRVSSVPLQELEWHLLAVMALLGASYTLQQGEHVRVDILYQRYSEGARRWLDALVPPLLIVPIALFVAYLSLHFVAQAHGIQEGSPDPGGLPHRFLLKAFIPVGFGLVAVQGVAMTLKSLAGAARAK